MLSFEELCGREAGEPGGRTRVAIFNAIVGRLDTGYFGVLTEGFPQLVRVNREVMKLDERQAWPAEGPVVCQIRMINEYPLIPDLERIEDHAARLPRPVRAAADLIPQGRQPRPGARC